jgi:serine/threonine protein kinase
MMTSTTRKRQQYGGHKLGAGHDGCVITPPIQCADSGAGATTTTTANSNKHLATKKYVSKLLYKMHDAAALKQENKLYAELRQIDPEMEYYIYPIKMCKIKDMDELEARPDIKFITFLPSYNSSHRHKYDYDYFLDSHGKARKINWNDKVCYLDRRIKPYNIISQHGGVDMYELLSHANSKFKYYRQYFRLHYSAIFTKLVIGLHKLHTNFIAHGDIKAENIVCTLPKKSAGGKWIYDPASIKFIDFGMSFNVPASYKKMVYTAMGTDIPFDIFIAHFIKSDYYGNLAGKIREQMWKMRDDYFYLENMWNIDDLPLVNACIKKIVSRINTQHYIKDYHTAISGIAYKSDIFALGAFFAYYCMALRIQLVPHLRDLIINMISIDPWKRYSIIQCIKHPFITNAATTTTTELNTS